MAAAGGHQGTCWANAFKFTHQGKVSLSIGLGPGLRSPGEPGLQAAHLVLPSPERYRHRHLLDKQQIIFDKPTGRRQHVSRVMGGTALAWRISREISPARGEIRLVSGSGQAAPSPSLPQTYVPLHRPAIRGSGFAADRSRRQRGMPGQFNGQPQVVDLHGRAMSAAGALPAPDATLITLVIGDTDNNLQPGDMTPSSWRTSSSSRD
ncbi:MAG: hypothetical protein U0793_25380 [Gemmataceae bacterium]